MVKKVIYIDEDRDQRTLIPPRIIQAFVDEIVVEALAPQPTVEKMCEFLISSEGDIISLIFDQILHETGEADYSGSDIAEMYRLYNQDIPIFILTSHPEDLEYMVGEYDFVLAKNNFSPNPTEEVKNLIRSHANKYQRTKKFRSERLYELLEKSVLDSLTEEEDEELSGLNVIRSAEFNLLESEDAKTMREKLDEQQKILDEIEKKINPSTGKK